MMIYNSNELDIGSLYTAVLAAYKGRSTTVDELTVERFLRHHPEIVTEVRESLLSDRIRAAYRKATMHELVPGDHTRLEPARASNVMIESGVSGRVRKCTIDEIPALTNEVAMAVSMMEVVTNDGRPMCARLRWKKE